jgi:integrase
LADLNFSHGIILIRDPKGESRQAYMTEEIKAMFLSRKPSGTADLIFPSRNGNRQISVSGAYERAVTRLGFNDGVQDIRDKVVFHSLRHTFASWLAIQGTPILTIKELMGHKSIEMTMRYAHLIPDQKHKAVRDMIETFSSSRDTASAYIDNDKQTA